MFPRFFHTHRGFTLIELMVGMLIFSIGMTSIYAILHSTFRNVSYSRHEVVVAGLLREQLELIKNIRDTNIGAIAPWDSVSVDGTPATFSSGVYIIENNFTSDTAEYNQGGQLIHSPITIKDVTSILSASPDLATRFANTRLYLDTQGRYTHTQTLSGTLYASYIMIRPLMANSQIVQKDGKNQGYTIDARVIVQAGNGYREYDTRTMITDWLR